MGILDRRSDVPPHGSIGLRDRSFLLLLAASFGAFSGYALLLPVVPLWAVAGGAGESGAGATTGVLMLATVVAQLAMPWLLVRAGHRATLGLGAVLLGAPAPAYAVSSALGMLLGVSALRGIGFGLVTVSGSALVAELLPASQRARGAGMYGLAVGLPTLVSFPGGVWAARNVGYAPMFWLAGALPVLGALAVLGMSAPAGGRGHPPVGPPGGSASVRSRLAVLASPWTVMVTAALSAGGLLTFLPLAVAGTRGAGPAALAAFSAAMIGFRWLAGVLGDRLGSGGMAGPGVAAVAGGMACLAVAAQSRGALVAAAAITGGFLSGAGFGLVQNDSLVMMFNRVGRHGYATASAAWNIAYDAGTGLGAVALGAVAAGLGFSLAFAAAAALLVLCLPVAAVTGWRSR